MICKKCKQTMKSLMFLALMIDMGAKSGSNPLICTDGNEHEFIDKKADRRRNTTN
jgi:hypothetical protein